MRRTLLSMAGFAGLGSLLLGKTMYGAWQTEAGLATLQGGPVPSQLAYLWPAYAAALAAVLLIVCAIAAGPDRVKPLPPGVVLRDQHKPLPPGVYIPPGR